MLTLWPGHRRTNRPVGRGQRRRLHRSTERSEHVFSGTPSPCHALSLRHDNGLAGISQKAIYVQYRLNIARGDLLTSSLFFIFCALFNSARWLTEDIGVMFFFPLLSASETAHIHTHTHTHTHSHLYIQLSHLLLPVHLQLPVPSPHPYCCSPARSFFHLNCPGTWHK